MKAIALENVSWDKYDEIIHWLHENFGKSSRETWMLDQDYDLLNLIMSDAIYEWYVLRWQ